MTSKTPVAVTSRSFSRHPVLRAELLERYEDVRFNDDGLTLEGSELVRFLSDRVKAITALERIDDDVLSHLPKLRLISKVGVGMDMIDLDSLRRHGTKLNFTPGTNKRSVSEFVLGVMITLSRHVLLANRELQTGIWSQPKGHTLSGKKVGIIGFGSVGQDLAKLLQPFECEIYFCDVRDVRAECDLLGPKQVELEDLLASCDVVTLHVALTPDTKNLLNSKRLRLLRPNAILVNTARGELVDEAYLKEQLLSGQLRGAALDVFATEPPQDLELINLPNFLGTPHIGGSTEEAILAMGRAAIEGLEHL